MDPISFGIANTTAACPEYSVSQNNASISLPECGVPLGEYYWYDQYHESWAITKLVAEGKSSSSTAGVLPSLTSLAGALLCGNVQVLRHNYCRPW